MAIDVVGSLASRLQEIIDEIEGFSSWLSPSDYEDIFEVIEILAALRASLEERQSEEEEDDDEELSDD